MIMRPSAFLALLALNMPVEALAALCPVALPVAGEFSSGFGRRHGGMHSGVDLRAPVGTPVHATLPSTVVFAGRYFDYGLMVEVQHEDGTRARYAHLARFAPGLARGTRLAVGQAIGMVGRTGRTTGPNLHVELRRGDRPVDPWPWMTRTACTSWTEVAEAEPIR
jgi:murein DD-endopeptidase MepM/ murein hydrolase activator NlpD